VGEVVILATVGTGLTVTVVVAKPPHPLKEITAVPIDTPVTLPEASTVATAVVPLLQLPLVEVSVKAVTAPTHSVVVPVIGAGVPFTVTVIVASLPHPLE
jgi:hypothetical protein